MVLVQPAASHWGFYSQRGNDDDKDDDDGGEDVDDVILMASHSSLECGGC